MVLTPVLCVALLAPALADKPVELLVGKWSAKEKMGDKDIEIVLDFTKDGVIKVTTGPVKMEATYKVVGDDKLEMTVDRNGRKETKTAKFKVTKDKLTISPEREPEKTFDRVK